MAEDYQNSSDSEESLYDEETREDSLDNDEITAEEEGFMKGYDEAEKTESPATNSEEEY